MNPLISTDELAAELARDPDDLRVFDCSVVLRRSDHGAFEAEPATAAFDEGHIPSSAFLDQVAELSDPDSALRFTALGPDELARAFGRRGVGPGTRVVVYDRAFNMWATRVWWLLRSIGFDDVAVLDGGWRAWTSDRRPTPGSVEGPPPAYSPVELTAEPRAGMLVERNEVEAATSDDAVCLINSLSAEVHDGTDISYGRPGHIPSSTNVYAIELCDPESHRYRPIDELRAMFDAVGVAAGQGSGGDGGMTGRIITWCGGGIAATSDAFTLHRLGHTIGDGGVGIYDGSLSDWISAGLPLAT